MQVYNWLIVGAALIVVAIRLYIAIRRMRAPREDDWDERLVKALRAQGGDPFSAYEVDFFFDLPDSAACEQVGTVLRAKDYEVDFRQVDADRGDRYTLHGRRRMRVSVPDMQALTRELRALAEQHAGRYDGWAAAGITRKVAR